MILLEVNHEGAFVCDSVQNLQVMMGYDSLSITSSNLDILKPILCNAKMLDVDLYTGAELPHQVSTHRLF
jgi:hypothetical protein